MTVRKSWAKQFSRTLDSDQKARPVEPISGLEPNMDTTTTTISDLRDQNLSQGEQIQALLLKVTKTEKNLIEMGKNKEIFNEEIKQSKDETSDLKNAISKANKEVKNLREKMPT